MSKSSITLYCTLCGCPLVTDESDAFGEFSYCSQTVKLPNGKVKSHFFYNADELVMHLLPFKLINCKNQSKLMILDRRFKKSSNIQFKTLAKLPLINPIPEKQLFAKLKLLTALL